MMIGFTKVALLALACAVGVVNAQLEYLEDPEFAWSTDFEALGDGNAVALSPDGTIVYATSATGKLGVMASGDGSVIKVYEPPSNSGLLLGSTSGVAFGASAALGEFVAYAVTDGLNQVEEFCRVAVVSHPSGDELFVSGAMPGRCMGDPVVGTDGLDIYMNSNSVGGNSGHFNLISTEMMGTVMFSSVNGDNATDFPFSALGCYLNPVQGAYDGGEGNRNDICLWASAPRPGVTGNYPGATYAFQRPTDPETPLAILTLLPNEDLSINPPVWQAGAAPLLTNDGLSAYWSVSRTEYRAWNGNPGVAKTYFDHGATSSQKGLPFASPRFLPNPNTVALSTESPPNLFAGLASANFVKMDFELTERWTKPVEAEILSEAKVSPDNERVYYVAQTGLVTSALTEDGTTQWDFPLGTFSYSEFDMSASGDTLYLGTTQGQIVAWTVAVPPPTSSPSSGPTVLISASPSKAPSPPTASPSLMPSVPPVPTEAPVAPPTNPTDAPVEDPTDAPVEPTDSPTTSGAFGMSVFSVLAAGMAAAMLS